MLSITVGEAGTITTTAVVGGTIASPCAAAVGIGSVVAVTPNCIVHITAVVYGFITTTDAGGGIIVVTCDAADGIGTADGETENCIARIIVDACGIRWFADAVDRLPDAGLRTAVAGSVLRATHTSQMFEARGSTCTRKG